MFIFFASVVSRLCRMIECRLHASFSVHVGFVCFFAALPHYLLHGSMYLESLERHCRNLRYNVNRVSILTFMRRCRACHKQVYVHSGCAANADHTRKGFAMISMLACCKIAAEPHAWACNCAAFFAHQFLCSSAACT